MYQNKGRNADWKDIGCASKIEENLYEKLRHLKNYGNAYNNYESLLHMLKIIRSNFFFLTNRPRFFSFVWLSRFLRG